LKRGEVRRATENRKSSESMDQPKKNKIF